MNRFEIETAAYKVDGYFIRDFRNLRSIEDDFEKAKKECLRNLQKDILNIQRLTFGQFKKCRPGFK